VPENLPLDERHLNEHSKTFASVLFSAHPSWREYAAMAASTVSEGMVLIVTVPPPESSQAEYPLTIDTDNDEVTVGFDKYHSHFYWPESDDEYENPLRFIEGILEERTVVVSIWSGEKWALSTTLDASKGVEDVGHIPDAATVAKLRSWTGKYSRDEHLPLRDGSIGR
jgi:hypothetical protein